MSEPKQTPKRMWDLKQRADAADTLDLYIYGDVAGDSQDWWTGEVIQSETSANALRDALAEYPDAKEIAIYINSYGGSVFEGTAIYNQLKRHSAHKTVYVDGFACSIASVIAMAGDTVVMPRNALMMIHNMSMGVYGTAAELRQAAENLDTINQAGMAAYLDKAGDKLDPEKLKEMYDAETWLTAEQCMALGLADQYADADADMSKAAEILQKANLTLEQRITVQKSLAAQLKQLTAAPAAPPPSPAPPAPQKPEQKNRIMSLFG
nr:MAG TPA: Putative ATP dependent Clp protease [Caudoviricetes sp.]DAH38230.1 MAG TPA: putative ATP dependent Clp protease [Caudoviricetes sp.]